MSAITFWYKNYRGEEGYRRATPISLRYGRSEWHTTPQWLMLAHDDEKDAPREFALADMRDIIGNVTVELAQAERARAWEMIAEKNSEVARIKAKNLELYKKISELATDAYDLTVRAEAAEDQLRAHVSAVSTERNDG